MTNRNSLHPGYLLRDLTIRWSTPECHLSNRKLAAASSPEGKFLKEDRGSRTRELSYSSAVNLILFREVEADMSVQSKIVVKHRIADFWERDLRW